MRLTASLRSTLVQIFLAWIAIGSARAMAVPIGSRLSCRVSLDGHVEEMPSLVQDRIAASLPERGPYRLVKLDSIHQATMFEPLRKANAVLIHDPAGLQIVHPTDHFGKGLLHLTKVSSPFRRRVFIITVVGERNQRLGASETIFGGDAPFDREAVTASVRTFIDRFKSDHADRIDGFVRIAHAHSDFDVFGQSAEDVRLWSLSRDHLDAAIRLSMTEGVPVVIENISPNGYSYSATYLRGENVTAQIDSALNPLSHFLSPARLKMVRINHLPGAQPILSKPIGHVPAWLAAKYEIFKTTGKMTGNATQRRVILRMARQDPTFPRDRLGEL